MKLFTESRHGQTTDECWVVQHDPVYTLGQAANKEHILDSKDIPIIQADRGGQVTYHGPGQWIFYLLVDLKRQELGIREFVSKMEQAVIDLLAEQGINAEAQKDAPGVYVEGAKIASLGLRVKRYSTYHGISLNIDMDLKPFSWINPCGLKGIKVINITDLKPELNQKIVKASLIKQLIKKFKVSHINVTTEKPEVWYE